MHIESCRGSVHSAQGGNKVQCSYFQTNIKDVQE